VSTKSFKQATTPLLDDHSLSDYNIFKCDTIRPSVINAHIRARMGTPKVSISFAPDQPSFDHVSNFFNDTEYTWPIPSKPLPLIPCFNDFPTKSILPLQGYISPKRADYFIWELGFFKEGAIVVPGDDLRLARIMRVEGVGRNFIKFGVEALGGSSKDEIPVWRMIISFSPGNLCLTRFQ